MKSRPLLACLVSLVSALPCFASTGILDQSNPFPGPGLIAVFEAQHIGSFWQQQVRAGVTGKLSGVRIQLSGLPGSHVWIRIRIGDGWNTGPTAFEKLVHKNTSAFQEPKYIDTQSANIQLVQGQTFVIEWEGQNDGGDILGNWVMPPTPHPYPEPLYHVLLLPNCYLDCGRRVSFETYMIPAAPIEYCTSGTSSNGCAATIHANRNPKVTQLGLCLISVDHVEGQRTGIVFYGLNSLPQPWCTTSTGTSFLCVKPPTMRTGVQSSGGGLNQCDGALALNWNQFQVGTPNALGAPWTAGDKVYVQAWFRDPPSCKTTALSNALELTYEP